MANRRAQPMASSGRLRDDLLQPARRAPAARWPKGAECLGHSSRPRERRERALAVQRGVDRHAQAELIRASVHALVAEDLGRDVSRCSDPARPRDVRCSVDAFDRSRGLCLADARHAEVADPGSTVPAQEHVLRLEVSMHEAGGVRRGQPARGLQIHAHHVRQDRGSAFSHSATAPPSMSSITTKSWSPLTPMSYTVAMLGWLKLAIA
jgi:hypothetical protein